MLSPRTYLDFKSPIFVSLVPTLLMLSLRRTCSVNNAAARYACTYLEFLSLYPMIKNSHILRQRGSRDKRLASHAGLV